MSFLLILVVGLTASGCFSKKKSTLPLVIVSIPPYRTLVQKLSGATCTVVSALPENHDPHTYEVTPRQMASLQTGSLWIGIGETYEKSLVASLRTANPSLHTLTLTPKKPLSTQSSLCSAHHGHVDIHFWLSVTELRAQLPLIAAALIKKWPEHRALYQNHLQDLLFDLDALHRRLLKKLAPVRGKALLTAHQALRYFCRDYHLTELALECSGHGPLPKSASAIAKKAAEESTLCAIALPNHSKKALSSLANTLNLPIFLIDPLYPDPCETIEELARVLLSALASRSLCKNFVRDAESHA